MTNAVEPLNGAAAAAILLSQAGRARVSA